ASSSRSVRCCGSKALLPPATDYWSAPDQDRLRPRGRPAVDAHLRARRRRAAHVAHAPVRQAAVAAARQACRGGEPENPRAGQSRGGEGAGRARARACGVRGGRLREGQCVTLTLDSVLVHSLCRLLQAAAKKSDWDIELRLPGIEGEEAP